ncbi:hypothetical protein, partial [Tsukamurella conjunctivitidis]|uniref:hypothetical protein n=1 Tax=Tsukamurella conjunctivitidis TaxID=2592068 RepID=UPI0013156CF9
ELFGEDFSRSGVLYSTDRDGYIPYRIVCSDGQLMTYNMLHGTDTPAGGQGLNGYIVSRQEAEQLAHEKLG